MRSWLRVFEDAEYRTDSAASNSELESSVHWMAESGMVDMFILLGPTPKRVLTQYSLLTGAYADHTLQVLVSQQDTVAIAVHVPRSCHINAYLTDALRYFISVSYI